LFGALSDPRRSIAGPLTGLPAQPSSPCVMYGFLRARQLEGTLPGERETGVWPITGSRIGYGWGAIYVQDWPDAGNGEDWPPTEPEGLDRVAKRMRAGYYQRVRSLEDCKQAIAVGHIPLVSVRITEAWFHAERGVIPDPVDHEQIIGSHAIGLVGYDDASRTISFANSWGRDWGDGGFGAFSYDYYADRSIETWVHTVGSLTWALARRAVQSSKRDDPGVPDVRELAWGVRDVLRGGTLHGCEVYDLANDERIGWAFAVERDGFLDIEELFVRPAFRRRGYAGKLTQILVMRSAALNLPLRLWVSYADCGPENRAALDGTLRRLGLHLRNSPFRWAAYVGLAGLPSARPLEPIVVPDRPALARGARRAAAAVLASSLAFGSPAFGATVGNADYSSHAGERSMEPTPLPTDRGSEQMATERYGIPGIEYDDISEAAPNASAQSIRSATPPAGDCDPATPTPAPPENGADVAHGHEEQTLLTERTDEPDRASEEVPTHQPNLKALAILNEVYERQRGRPTSQSGMTQGYLREARAGGMYGYGDGSDK
jgi:GNAT superfamily N-acetyltransferase